MKIILINIGFLVISISAFAQIAIGKVAVDGDAILDFQNPTTKGIALPKITSLDASTVAGTLYFDAIDTKVKCVLDDPSGTGTITMDLSVKSVPTMNEFNVTSNGYGNLKEVAETNGTVLGDVDAIGIPNGVLVLQATDKAMVLPKMANPHLIIKNPEAGMIAYDIEKKMLCVYNGYKWSFWGE